MRYQVPQFIEVEDKIFGPFTLRQFIYLAGTAGAVAIILLNLPMFFGLLLSIPFIALGMSLAFLKINDRPFVEVIESGFFFLFGDKLYLWRKGSEVKSAPPKEVAQNPTPEATGPRPETLQKIRSLAWSLDVQDSDTPYGTR